MAQRPLSTKQAKLLEWGGGIIDHIITLHRLTKFLMGFMELGYRHAFTHLINFLLLPQQCVQALLFKAFQHRSPLLLLLRVTKMITLFCWKLTFARELDAHIQPKCSTKKHYTRHSEEFYTMQSEVDTKNICFLYHTSMSSLDVFNTEDRV